MTPLTLGKVDARLVEIEELIWKVDIGALTMHLADWKALNAEAFELEEIMCTALSKASGREVSEIATERRQMIGLRRFSKILERFTQLHPSNRELEPLSEAVQSIFDGKTPDEAVLRRINSITSSLFVPRPDAIQPKKSWFKRAWGN